KAHKSREGPLAPAKGGGVGGGGPRGESRPSRGGGIWSPRCLLQQWPPGRRYQLFGPADQCGADAIAAARAISSARERRAAATAPPRNNRNKHERWRHQLETAIV